METNKQRVENDIRQFREKADRHRQCKAKEIAERYAHDAEFFLGKGDVFTAWGCINYAFGLLDAELEYKK